MRIPEGTDSETRSDRPALCPAPATCVGNLPMGTDGAPPERVARISLGPAATKERVGRRSPPLAAAPHLNHRGGVRMTTSPAIRIGVGWPETRPGPSRGALRGAAPAAAGALPGPDCLERPAAPDPRHPKPELQMPGFRALGVLGTSPGGVGGRL